MINGFFDEFRFLSNFWYAEVTMGGYSYPTVEHAYQAAKFSDPEERKLIREATTPGRAKRVAWKMVPDPDWDNGRISVMRELVQQKFARHEDLRIQLLLTHPHELEETNHWGDHFWGRCVVHGELLGENQLGKILMKVRDDFRLREVK